MRAKPIAGVLIVLASPAVAQDDFTLDEPPAAKAAPVLTTSLIEVGIGWQSVDSFYFGRYGGNAARGIFVFGDGAISRRPAWDSGSAVFTDARFSFIDDDTWRARLATGVQGRWKVDAFVNTLTRRYTESARTPYDGAGTDRLTLPGSWLSRASSLQFTNLPQILKPLELQTRWQSIGGDYVLNPREHYELRVHFDHRKRDGLMASGITFGHEGNFAVGAFFPQPVDYDSNRLKLSLSFADGPLQWSAAYSFATFTNSIKSILVPNPFARSLGLPWPGGAFAGFPIAIGQYSLAPDNSAHQFMLAGGYALSPRTRLTARLSYAIQTQNEPFLPYSPVTQLVVHTPVPRASLDGRVGKTFANVAMTSREWDKTEFSAGYTFDQRNNSSPIDLYNYIPADSQDQGRPAVAGVSRYIRYNLPHSYLFHGLKAEAAYRPFARTLLSLAYTGDFRKRNYQQVEHSNEHALKAKAQTTFEAGAAWVSYSYADRGGSEYLDAVPWDASHTTNYLNAGPANQSIEFPLLRRSYLAERKRREARGGASLDVTPRLSVDAGGGYARDNYHHSEFGLRASQSLLLDASLAYTVTDKFNASVFYSFEEFRFDQKGYYVFNANLTNPAHEWIARSADETHSAGARFDWQASDALKVEAAYTLSHGTPRVDVSGTGFTPLAVTAAFPASRELTHNVSLNGQYRLNPSASVKLGYFFERHKSVDWQYDNIGFAPVAQIIGSGILPPRYRVHVVSISALYAF